MKLYKLKQDALLTKYNPNKKNLYGGIGAEVVGVLKKNEIVLIKKIEPNTLRPGKICDAIQFCACSNSFVSTLILLSVD